MLRLCSRVAEFTRLSTVVKCRSNDRPKLKHDWTSSDSWDLTKATNGPTLDKWEYYNNVVWPPDYNEKGKAKLAEVFHSCRDIKYSPDKMWYICYLIRGRPIDEALKQLSFVAAKGAIICREVLLEAQDKAVKQHNVEFKSNLWIAEAFAVKSQVIKGVRRHARGRHGIVHYKFCNLFIRLEEGKPPLSDFREPPRDGWTQMSEYVQWLRSRKVELGW